MATTSTLTRKTKAELIAAYEELLAKQQGMKTAAKETYASENNKLFETASTYTPESVEMAATTLRTTLIDAVGLFTDAFEAEARKFEELKQAIDLAQARLKLHHDIEVGATVLQEIIAEHEARRDELERTITTRKRDWEREQEELEYRTKTMRARSDEEQAQTHKKREALLKEREAAAEARETEFAELKMQVATMQSEIDKAVEKQVAEVRKELDEVHKRSIADKDRECAHAVKLLEFEKKSRDQEISRQANEIGVLRKEAEQANKKAQDLAARIIESRTDRTPASVANASTSEVVK